MAVITPSEEEPLTRMSRHVTLAAPLALILASGAAADTIIVTQNAASTGGSGAYSTILNSQARSWLTVIGQAELSGRLPVGAQVTGVAWHNASW